MRVVVLHPFEVCRPCYSEYNIWSTMCVSINGPGDPDLWPFYLETDCVRIASKVENLPSKFWHVRPLGSWIIRYVRDGRTDRRTDGRTKATLIASFPTGEGILISIFVWRVLLVCCDNSWWLIEGCQSRESLPEIVVDHERPGVDGSTSPGEDADARTVTQMEISTQKTGDVSSPSNDYEYVLHKFHHEQRGRPGHASPASVSSPAWFSVNEKWKYN